MPYPLAPLSTEPAEWYKIGQKATDAAKHVEQVKDADGDRHEWISDTVLTSGGGTSTPPPVNDLTSTDPLAYASANQLRVLEQALVSGVGTLTAANVLILKDRAGNDILPGVNLSALKDILVLDGNERHVVRTNATVGVAPTAIEVPAPILGDTATVFLTDKSIEHWTFGTVWTKDYTQAPTVLDGNDKHVLRTNAIASVAPTAIEVPSPVLGDTAKVSLTDKSIEYWSYNGTAWVKDFTYSIAPDEVINVTGATLPITFPTTTIPGTPVFLPATPASLTAIYAVTNGSSTQYAKWNGTQYISSPAPLTTVSNTVAGVGLTRSITTTVNGVTGAPVFIPDQNNSILTIGGTAAAPTISNDGGVASVALPAVPPTSNTFVVTKAGGAVSTVQGVSGTQAIPSGTIVETLGYNAAGAPVYQAIATAAPQTADNGLTKTANNTQLGGTLITPTTVATTAANTLAITGLIANATPTDFVTRDATGKLTQSSLASVAPNVTFGTVAPVIAPTNKKGDEYYITSTGTSAGAIQSRWIYDGTIWVNTATTVPDDIVDVSGATLPITFPVATLPGTPVFVPATPTSATAIYAITNGTAIQYAKYSGGQYISSPAPLTPNVRYGIPAPTIIAGTDKKNDTYIQTVDGTSAGAVIAEWVYDGTIWKNVTVSGGGHFRSGTGTTAPDGVADPTENVSRIGKTGFGITDPSTLKFAYELDGTTGIRQDVLANATAGCLIPATATSSKSSIVVTQTVTDAALFFAAPNVPAMAGQVFTVINSDLSTNKISYLGYDIHPNQSLTFVHTGRMWQIEEVGINSDVQLETAATVLPTSLTALNSFTVVPGGIQSSTTSWVEVPGTSFVATAGGEYLVKYVAYASCSGGLPVSNASNGFRIAVGSNIATGTVQVTVPATGRIIATSESLITNVVAGQIDPYTKTVIVKAKPGETIQLQMNSQVGAQIVYQSSTQNSRLEYSKIVNSTPIAYAATTQLAGSTTAYTYLPLDNNLIVTGGAGVVQPITTPSASAFPGREISLQMPEVTNYEVNLISGGGNIELPDYSFTGSARLSSGAVASLTWQSDGTAWRLMSYSERKFYSTASYSIPLGGNFITFLGAGGVAPAPGVAFQIPANTTSWLAIDGNYTPLVALPIANTVNGRFSLYANNSGGFDTIISTVNTNLPRNTAVPSGQGRSMHFEWSDGKWRWVPSPEIASAGVRVQRRGTFAAPLTGAITVAIDDFVLVVGNGSATTLPSPAAPNIDRLLRIKKPGVGTASLVGSIDGVANLALSGVSESLDLQSDGTTWMRI